MDTITVTDLYQATWFLINGSELREVECIPIGGQLACRLTFSGLEIPILQEQYFTRQAAANLFAFRQGYNQINSFMHQAKKSFNQKQRELKAAVRDGEACTE